MLSKYLEVSDSIYVSIADTRLLGPMMVMNNNGILVSSITSDEEINILKVKTQIQDILGVSVISMSISGFIQTGAMIVATNKGAVAYPDASDDEIKTISDILNVNV